MLDDDLKKIEDFLKTGGDPELQFLEGDSELRTFQNFEKIINDFLIKGFNFEDNVREDFATLNKVTFESYTSFKKNKDEVIKDFAITIIITKKLLEVLQNTKNNTFLSEEDKKLYFVLIKVLMNSLKKVSETQLNFFKVFSKYIDEINNIINIED